MNNLQIVGMEMPTIATRCEKEMQAALQDAMGKA